MSAVSAKINANLLDVVQQERIEEPGAEMSYIVLINMTIRVLPDPSPHWSKCKHDGREQVASEIPEYVTATPHPCFWNPQTFVHQGPEMALKAKKNRKYLWEQMNKGGQLVKHARNSIHFAGPASIWFQHLAVRLELIDPLNAQPSLRVHSYDY